LDLARTQRHRKREGFGAIQGRIRHRPRLLRKMLLVALGALRNPGPFLRRTQEDVAKMVTIRADPARIIEGSGIDESHPRTPFEWEADGGPASGTKLNVEPASRSVRGVPVLGERPTGDLDVLFAEHRLDCECTSSSSLAPRAVAHGYSNGVTLGHIAHGPADA